MKEKVPVLLALLMILLMGVSGVIFMRYLEVSEQNRVLREELLQATGEIHRIREEMPSESLPEGFPNRIGMISGKGRSPTRGPGWWKASSQGGT